MNDKGGKVLRVNTRVTSVEVPNEWMDDLFRPDFIRMVKKTAEPIISLDPMYRTLLPREMKTVCEHLGNPQGGNQDPDSTKETVPQMSLYHRMALVALQVEFEISFQGRREQYLSITDTKQDTETVAKSLIPHRVTYHGWFEPVKHDDTQEQILKKTNKLDEEKAFDRRFWRAALDPKRYSKVSKRFLDGNSRKPGYADALVKSAMFEWILKLRTERRRQGNNVHFEEANIVEGPLWPRTALTVGLQRFGIEKPTLEHLEYNENTVQFNSLGWDPDKKKYFGRYTHPSGVQKEATLPIPEEWVNNSFSASYVREIRKYCEARKRFIKVPPGACSPESDQPD